MDDWGLHKWYCSRATGKMVKTRREAILAAVLNLFKFRMADFRWTIVWLNR